MGITYVVVVIAVVVVVVAVVVVVVAVVVVVVVIVIYLIQSAPAPTETTLTNEELQVFLRSGMRLGRVSKDVHVWPNQTIVMATAWDASGTMIYQQKHMSEEDSYDHAEVKFMTTFRKQFEENQQRMNGDVQLLSNYSPCRGCAEELVGFQQEYPNLTIRIRFVHLYKVKPSPRSGVTLEEAWRNIQGLRMLQGDDTAIELENFSSGYDWLQLLLVDRGLDEEADRIKARSDGDQQSEKDFKDLKEKKVPRWFSQRDRDRIQKERLH